MTRKLIILTEGHSNPATAKTACSVIRYRGEEVVAVLDSTQAGKTAQELFCVGGDIPIVRSVQDAPSANTLLIGIAPTGGKIPAAWRLVILSALAQGLDIVSGLHDFLTDDAQFVAAAAEAGSTLTDVRKNDQRDVARRQGLRPDCLRIHTVGNDCSIGKMVVSIEVAAGLRSRGHDAKFVATGQTGIMVEGDGCPIDCVVADFVSGAAEKLVLENQEHEILLVEGQGSLAHPSYSAVTLGLLHGCLPHALILCYEAGREMVHGVGHVRIPPLARILEAYETMARLMRPCDVIGIAMNSRTLTPDAAEQERERIRNEFGLPVCDVFRHGADDLVEAVLKFQAETDWQGE